MFAEKNSIKNSSSNLANHLEYDSQNFHCERIHDNYINICSKHLLLLLINLLSDSIAHKSFNRKFNSDGMNEN